MSDRTTRDEIKSWSPSEGSYEGDGGHAVDSAREPAVALLRAEAALAAARNEIALLRARVERLQEDNERLEQRVAALTPAKSSARRN